LYEFRIHEKNIRLDIDNKNDIKVNADIEMLKTVMRNLISNAVKFTDRGGQLSISAVSNRKYAIISVSDTGIGMESEIMDKLFDLKTSFSTQGTDGEKGSGIGLMLTRDFVERNKGQLSVESTPGKGTTFKFSVPLA
jgi:signal transduction histidine kinase